MVFAIATTHSPVQRGIGLAALPDGENVDAVCDAFEDMQHLLLQASSRSRSKRVNELCELGDLSVLRERALQAGLTP